MMFCSLVRVLILMCACVEGALVVVKGDRNVWGRKKLRGNAIALQKRTVDGPFFETNNNSFTLDFEFLSHNKFSGIEQKVESVITKRSFYRFHYFLKRTASSSGKGTTTIL